MRKTLLLLATIAILLMSLTACGEDKKNDGGMVSDVESGISSIVSETESMLGNDSGNVSSNASK